MGDITDKDVDAIVNAANNDLTLGGGLAGAIRKKGGESVQEECNRAGPVKVGEAAITGGGNLKAKYVIHAASMRLGGLATAESLRSSVAHTLRIAEEKKLKTIAFPAIGTGIAGFPREECARITLEEVAKHLKKYATLQKVHIVLFDEETHRIFRKEFERMFGSERKKA